MKKTFIITMLGEPFDWIQDYIDNVQHLADTGWEWKIFTSAKIENKGNVEIVPMTTDQFNDLVEKKLGVRPNMFITEKGVPSVHVTDFYVFSGLIFEDYLKDSEWWGITNLDVVYGNLSRFVSDRMLDACDVYTDDIDKVVNGVFSLWKNCRKINELCLEIPNWKEVISQQPCQKCLGFAPQHTLFGSDEYSMTDLLKNREDVSVICPRYYPEHSHDRLENHVPEIKLKIQEDGSLWELLMDVKGPQWIHARPFIGREIPWFHFQRTKMWPKCLKNDLS